MDSKLSITYKVFFMILMQILFIFYQSNNLYLLFHRKYSDLRVFDDNIICYKTIMFLPSLTFKIKIDYTDINLESMNLTN